MKILIITSQIPYPPYRGDRLKIYNLTQILRKNNQVKILTFLRKPNDLEYLEKLKSMGFDIEAFPLPYYKSLFNLSKAFFNSMPLEVLAFYSSQMKKRIQEITEDKEFDFIYFHLIVCAQYLKFVRNKNIIKVLDFTDATSLYLTRFLQFIKNPIKKIIYKMELKRVISYEKYAKNFDTLFVCSNIDKKFLEEKKVHHNIQILLNGYDKNTFKVEKAEKEKDRIIFVGNMPYFPNIEAVKYFSKEIFPLILKEIPSAKFYIVGQSPTKEILQLNSSNIIVSGFVKDITKEYLQSSVNVVPVKLGAGTPNKIIESLALGVPTVATSQSASGLPDELKKYVFTADSAEEFSKYVIKILRNEIKYSELMEECILTIDKLLTWDKIVGNFEYYMKKRLEV